MKKLFSMLLFGALCVLTNSVNAQFAASTLYGSAPNQYTSLDTVTDAGSKTYSFKITDNRNSIVFQLNGKKISGTVAGTIKLFGSIDGGNNFSQIDTTVTITNGDQCHSFLMRGNPYTHYRVTITGTGSQSSSWRTYLMVR